MDITAVLNVHSEGILSGPSFISFEQAIEAARSAGLEVEGLIVLDRPDDATRWQFEDKGTKFSIIVTDEGDPGLARNSAVAAAKGQFVGFLDGDDLWSQNWLWLAHRLCAAEPDLTVAHSEFNVVFGGEQTMWWHIDSRDPAFDPDFLRYNNCWDALSFAARAIYEAHPFAATDRRRGFGHEDWHWNCLTLGAGIDHRPVRETVHFKRRRKNSQLALNDAALSIPRMTPLASYGWTRQIKQKGESMPGFDRYVSLGRDCEVGFQLKRVRGAQESGFFNWNFTDPAALISLLRSDFSGILQEKNLSIHGSGALIKDSSHDYFLHHEFDLSLFKNAPDFAVKLKLLQEKFRFFVESFRRNAQSPEVTAYFLKCEEPGAKDIALTVQSELLRYHQNNPFTLIVLQTIDKAEEDWGISGIHNRYMKRFAPHNDALDGHVPSWDNVFREFPHRQPLLLANY